MSQPKKIFGTDGVRGIANIATHYVVDKGMNRLIGPSWRKMKERLAERRAESAPGA